MIVAAVCLPGHPLHAGSLTEMQRFEWHSDADGFGGMSDLLVEPGGAGLIAVSDRGLLFRARIARDGAGRIVGLASEPGLRFRDNAGVPVNGFKQDAEDLSWGSDGEIVVAFESYARISAFRLPGLVPRRLHEWDRFRRYWTNTAFEGLATLPDGRLIAVVEAAEDGAYRTFLGPGGGWQAGPPLPAPDGFSATGADVGPDGALYVLERRLSILMSVTTRVRRFPMAGAVPGEGEVLLETASGSLPNMEGISLWRAPDGTVMVTLISDDGFVRSDPTLLVEYRLTE